MGKNKGQAISCGFLRNKYRHAEKKTSFKKWVRENAENLLTLVESDDKMSARFEEFGITDKASKLLGSGV